MVKYQMKKDIFENYVKLGFPFNGIEKFLMSLKVICFLKM